MPVPLETAAVQHVTLIVRNRFQTDPNTFGLWKEYLYQPSYDPDAFILPEDLYHPVTFLGTWPTFFFLFLTAMYLYDHMTLIHMTDYLYTRATLPGTPLFPLFVHFLLFSLYGSL